MTPLCTALPVLFVYNQPRNSGDSQLFIMKRTVIDQLDDFAICVSVLSRIKAG